MIKILRLAGLGLCVHVTIGIASAQFIQQPPIRQTPEPPLAEPGRANVVPAPRPPVLTAPPLTAPALTAPAPLPGFTPEISREDPPTPVVAIRVRVPATAAAGQELEYHICIENLSAAPAHHVIVRNPLPPNARYVRANPEPSAKEPELIWNLGTLAACACREITLVLSPTGTGDIQDCARVQFEHGQCVTTRITRPAISVRKTGPSQAAVNSTLNYQVTVTNTGGTELAGVVLSDQLPQGLNHVNGRRELTWDLGTLLPGQSRVVDYQLTAASPGRFRNKATVMAAGGVRDEVEHEVVIVEAKIGLNITGLATGVVNAAAAYQITVNNAGTLPLTNVMITDPVPAQMNYLSSSAGGMLMRAQAPTVGPDLVQWAIGTLEPGASRTVDVVFRATAPGRHCQQARATSAEGLTAQKELCTDFEGQAGLLLMVVDTVDPVAVGGQTSYKITIRNQGFVRATNVRIQAEVPAELTVTDAKGPSNYHKEGQILTMDPISVEPNRDATYEVFVRGEKAGDLRFKVDMTADQLTSGKPVHREESTTVFNELKNGKGQPQKRIIEGQ